MIFGTMVDNSNIHKLTELVGTLWEFHAFNKSVYCVFARNQLIEGCFTFQCRKVRGKFFRWGPSFLSWWCPPLGALVLMDAWAFSKKK